MSNIIERLDKIEATVSKKTSDKTTNKEIEDIKRDIAEIKLFLRITLEYTPRKVPHKV
jgi:ribosome-interacting GTPase 1